MKFYLANGTCVVPENEQETAFLLERFGLTSTPEVAATATQTAAVSVVPTASAATEPATPSTWSSDRARHFMSALGDSSRKLIQTLMRGNRSAMTTTEAARAMALKDAKPLGSMMATIRRVAQDMRLEPPVTSEISSGGARVLRLEQEFRSALEA